MVLIMINHTTPFLLVLQSTWAFLIWLDRSNHQRYSVRKGVLRNFRKFTGKHLCQSLFLNTVVGLRPATLLKKSLWHRCFPVSFMKFLKTPFLQNISGRLLPTRKRLKYVTPLAISNHFDTRVSDTNEFRLLIMENLFVMHGQAPFDWDICR